MSSQSSYTLRGSTNLKRRRSNTVEQFCGECTIYKDTTTTCEDYAQQLLLQSNRNNNNNNKQQHTKTTKITVSTIEEARLLILNEHEICSTSNNNDSGVNNNKADILNEAIIINTNNNEQPPSSTSSTIIKTTPKTTPKTIIKTTRRRNLQAPTLPPSAFCNTCMWQEGTPYTCSERSTFLQDNYELTSDEAMVGLMDQGYCVDPNYFDRVAAEKLAMEQAEAQKLLDEQNSKSGGGGSGAAIGGAIVGILVVVALVVGVLLVRKRRKTNAAESEDGSGNKKGDATKDVSDNEYEQDPENQFEYAPAGAAVEMIPSTTAAGSGTPETAPMGSVSDVSPKTTNTPRGAAAAGGDDPSTSGGSTGSGTSAQILKKLKDLRNKASRRASLDETPTHENTKKEEEMSRKELLELLKKERERVGEAAPPSSKSATAPPPVADPEEASVEIWIECDKDNQTCAQSVLTWDVDDDWSGMTPKYKPDPTGDTNHVEQLPSMNEMESQEDSYPSRGDDNNSGRYAPGVKYGLKSDPDDASQEKNNKRGFIPRRLSTSAKKNPSWFKNNNQGGGDDDDDSTFRGSGGSKATMAQALNPKAMKKAKDIKYPQGDVTIIYTDVQGSTSFWETCPSDMKTATDIHDKIMRQCYTDHQGYEITTEGDAFNLAFQHPADALAFALQAQIKLYKADWPEGILKHPDGKDEPALKLRGFRVRFGLHHGPTTSRVHEMTGRMVYYGEGVKLAKTVEGMCHGGQILTTMETWKAVSGMAERYLGRPQILDCGEHLLFERTNLIGPNAGKTTTRHTKRIMQLVPSELAFDFFEARGRRDVPSKDGTMGYEVKDASKVSGRQFPPLISKKLLTTSFIDAPYENGTVTICFVYTIGLKDDIPDKRSKNLGVLAKYVRTELLALSPPGYECQEDNGCWMLAFDRMVHAVSFGLRLKSTVGRATDLVGNVDKENMFKVGIVSGPFTSMGPHKTTGMADYFGPIVNRAARVASNCQPGQVCIGMPLSNGSSVLESSDRQFQDLDASEREMNSNVDHDKTTIPRELADEEIASLRMMLKKKLHICNEDHAADADDLLDYAIEMIEEGKSVGYVTVELNLMEMEVFPHEVSDGFGKCMSTFLLGLSEEDMSNGMIEEKNDENDDLKIDLGPKINVRLQGIKKLKGIAIDVAIFACSKKE